MTRWFVAILAVGILVAGWAMTPVAPSEPAELILREPAATPTVVCPVTVERSSDGTIRIGSTSVTPVRLTFAQRGEVTADLSETVGSAGGLAVPYDDLGVGGRAGALLEYVADATAAASVSTGEAGVAAADCTPLTRSTSMLVGGSTANGQSLDLLLVNPYGSDAVVEVLSASEEGLDSADELSAVTVPARSSVVADVADLLPLRNRLSMTVTATRGLVHAFLVGGGGDRVEIEQAAPAPQWVVPVPRVEGNTATLVIATASPVDITVAVDGRADGAASADLFTGTVPARGQVEIPIPDDPAVDLAEVFADGPVVAAIVTEGDAGRGVANAVPLAESEWLMPGAGDPGGVAWVAVPGDADATLEFRSLSESGTSFTETVPAGRTTAVRLRPQEIGYFVRADVPVAIIWSVSDDTGIGLASAVSVPVGE